MTIGKSAWTTALVLVTILDVNGCVAVPAQAVKIAPTLMHDRSLLHGSDPLEINMDVVVPSEHVLTHPVPSFGTRLRFLFFPGDGYTPINHEKPVTPFAAEGTGPSADKTVSRIGADPLGTPGNQQLDQGNLISSTEKSPPRGIDQQSSSSKEIPNPPFSSPAGQPRVWHAGATPRLGGRMDGGKPLGFVGGYNRQGTVSPLEQEGRLSGPSMGPNYGFGIPRRLDQVPLQAVGPRRDMPQRHPQLM